MGRGRPSGHRRPGVAGRQREREIVQRQCLGAPIAELAETRQRDAMLLGGTVFGLLEEQQGTRAAAALARSDLERGPRSVLVDAFGRQLTGVEQDWRELLASL